MSAVEWWVLRIVATKDQLCTPAMAKKISDGTYQVVNGDVVEPIDCCDSQDEAMRTLNRETARTGQPHKVTMNADLDQIRS